MGLFHAGVTWRAFRLLVSPTASIRVELERSLRVGGKLFVPDLIVRCGRTSQVLLVVEVWHTHAVSIKKRSAFNQAGFPWIEVRSWHVLSRHRRRALPVLDWGGMGLPSGPEQFDLFCTSKARRDVDTDDFATALRVPRESRLPLTLESARVELPL